MALNLLLLAILISNIFLLIDAQSVGVCYGEFGEPLPTEQEVVNLYLDNGITRMRIYAPNQTTLQALVGTKIELILGVPNGDLETLATNPDAATAWVENNILNYPNVNFRYISVGNEVDPNNKDTSEFVEFVLPAMRNVQSALGMRDDIKVSTATYTGLLNNSYPPSEGAFHDNVSNYIQPIIEFLAQNGSPMLANIYPYFAHIGPPVLPDISFALFTRTTPAYTDQGGRQYSNLFDAMYDAHYAAQARLGGGDIEIVVSESGWPSAEGPFATIENARTYYTNLISHVKSSRGTPARPGRVIETYLFAMFDENQKPGAESEKHFGVFSPDQQSKYQLRF